MKHIAHRLLMALSLIAWAGPSWAASEGAKIPVCRQEVIDQFCKETYYGESDLTIQAPLNRCLNEMMVCRRYGELSNKLLAAINKKQAALPPIQQYFLGSSLYHLHMQSRSEAVRCELGKMAKDQLQDFLMTAKLDFDGTGSFGNVGLRYLRDAVNSIQTLSRPNNCPESALSYTALLVLAKQAATEETENLFRSIDIPDPSIAAGTAENPVVEKMNTIFTDLRAITSKASELEIGAKMIETELAANELKMANIIKKFSEDLYKRSDGAVTYDEATRNMSFPARSAWLTAADDKVRSLQLAQSQMEAAKTQALNVMRTSLSGETTSEDAYNRLRIKYSSLAMNWAAEAAFQGETSRTILFDEQVNRLISQAAPALPSGNPIDSFKDSKKMFRDKNAAVCGSLAGRNRWFCK